MKTTPAIINTVIVGSGCGFNPSLNNHSITVCDERDVKFTSSVFALNVASELVCQSRDAIVWNDKPDVSVVDPEGHVALIANK